LAFATAENSPDRLLDAVFVDDLLVLFGAETVEFWPNTNDAELPFVPLEGRVFERGIKATGCAVVFNSDIAWVANDNTVRVGGSGQIVSDHALEESIAEGGTVSAWTYFDDGHEMLAITVDAVTYTLSNRSSLWSKMEFYGGQVLTCYSNGHFGGSAGLCRMTKNYLDFGTVLERRFRSGFPLNGGAVRIDTVRLRANPGQTSYLTGTYAEPTIEMRISRDAGQTWGNWSPTKLGQQGQYKQMIEWRACGVAKSPGALFEFRVTDPVPLAVTGVFMNEPRP
jgi:hypothetical protein